MEQSGPLQPVASFSANAPHESVYTGRTIICGMSNGSPFIAYRLSSRSFTKRYLRLVDPQRVAVLPTQEQEDTIVAARFIYYDCMIHQAKGVIVTNGLQTESIATKIKRGTPPLDALVLGMLSWDYEDDAVATPRISAFLSTSDQPEVYLAVVRRDGLQVERLSLKNGTAYLLSTSIYSTIDSHGFNWNTGQDINERAQLILDGSLPVRLYHALGVAVWQNGGFAVLNQ
jgi:IMP cyclohydrolase